MTTVLSRRLALAATVAVMVLTSLGLLCVRIHPYDDAALLVGARMTQAGLLPYSDFYAHYGPLGFTAQGVLSAALGQPALALRAGQAILFCLLAALALLVARRAGGGTAAATWAAALAALAISPAALLASFYGFGLMLACLGCHILAQSAELRGRALRWEILAGALLAATALVRPVFALYAGCAIALVAAADLASRRASLAPVLAAACVAGLAILWLLLYRRIPVGQAFEATLLLPARLISAGGRFREAPFLRAPLPLALLTSSLLAAVPLVWAAALPGRRSRFVVVGAALAMGAFPLCLVVSPHPARDASRIALAILTIAAAVLFVQRRALGAPGALRASALLGMATAAAGHYFWARSDRPHLIPYIVCGALGAILALGYFRSRGRWVLLALFAFDSPVFLHQPEQVVVPVEALWNGGLSAAVRNLHAPGATWRSIWPCGEVDVDAARAVAAADRNASPSSRFVAAASSQATTDEDPILLFLLSKRLPYTPWYMYDPGVQSSASVQALMIQDLARSGSRTAVIWRPELFEGQDATGAALPSTPFDEALDRTFPITAARYGGYEVRVRADSDTSAPAP